MIKMRSYWFMPILCLVLLFSLSIWTERGQSSPSSLWEYKHTSVSQSQMRETQKIPYYHDEERWEFVARAPIQVTDTRVTLNPFGRWKPDTIDSGKISAISISVTASNNVPVGTQVTLSFGSSVTGGSVNFTITPATQGEAFTFQIGPDEQKIITAKYQPSKVTGKPKVKAICHMSVTPPQGYQGNVTGQQPIDGQESSSELWIR